ncbi:calcium-translocating P-type ATPase [Wallemia mellicola]|nr:calcium-translocating P-type ATPase [Wallemia mellicola]
MDLPKINIQESPTNNQPNFSNHRNSDSLTVPRIDTTSTSRDPFRDHTEPSSPTSTSDRKGKDEKKSKKSKKPLEPRHINNLGAFKFQPHTLSDCVGYKQFETLRDDLGGIEGLTSGLGTHPKDGLCGEAYSLDGKIEPDGPPEGRAGPANQANGLERHRVYDKNEIPPKDTKNFFQLMWMAMEDKLLQLLIVAAIVALALGIYQAVDFPPPVVRCFNEATGRYDAYCTEPQVEWVEGVAILIAILIVVLVGSINDYQKELQFMKLNQKKDDREVKVKRDGNEQYINIKNLLVGDILQIETGDILPVDGVFLRGHNLKADESAATGESDAIKKVTFDEYSEYLDSLSLHDKSKNLKKDCFLLSGSKITEGVGEMVIVAVGLQSYNGRILASLNEEEDEGTPLQTKLNDLAELIAKIASVAGLLLFIALMIKFFVNLKRQPDRTPREKGQNFIEVLIIAVTLIVVAVPEGLPLAVTLALAFATKRMTKANLLVRLLASCETMANATAVCTDKTGTLTQNVMSVVAGTIGIKAKFVTRLDENSSRSNADELNNDEKYPHGNFTIDSNDLSNHVQGPLRKLLFDSIAINSTAFEDKNKETDQIEFVGSKTETALLRFAKEQDWDDWRSVRESAEIVQMIPFSSTRKAMGVVVKVNEGHYRLFVKGASEVLTSLTNQVVSLDEAKSDEVPCHAIEEGERASIDETIKFYANQSLRTIALCYKDFQEWPPSKASFDETGDVEYDSLAKDLTLIGITAIEDPLRPGVSNAVKRAQNAGVKVKMCTGDNVLTAQSIAKQCGILTEGGIVMEGTEFRQLDEHDRINVVQNLQVLARSSPDDKKLLVQTLRNAHSETVGVTGDGTNDAPALKAANVGFSMGIAGTEVAKEASSIILMDDNFASIVSAIMWGRCVNDSVKKFLQFQLSVNVTAIIIVFVTAIASDSEESVLSAVQLLWVNLIMDTFAALALATDPATPTVLDRKPETPGSPIINANMLKVITSQSLYKTAVVFVLHFAGRQILGYRMDYSNDEEEAEYSAQGSQLKTLVFNAFVWCQIFNQINCRRLDNKLNVFEGIHRNWWFMIMFCIMVGGQVLIVFVGGAAFSVTRIGGRDWAISIICGFCSLIVGALFRFIPDEPIERRLIKWGAFPDPNALPISKNKPSRKGEDPVYDSLQILSILRGGRIRGSSFVQKSRRIVRHPIQQLSETLYSHSRSNSGTTTPDNNSTSPLSAKHNHLDALSVLPMMVASSVGAGPAYRSSRSGSVNSRAGHSPSTSISKGGIDDDNSSQPPPSPLSKR